MQRVGWAIALGVFLAATSAAGAQVTEGVLWVNNTHMS
jgi:hypothetical protein